MKYLFLCIAFILLKGVLGQTIRLQGTVVMDSISENLGQFTIHSLPDSALIKGGYIEDANFSSTFKTRGIANFYIRIRMYEYRDTLINFTVNDTLVTLEPIVLDKNRNLEVVDIVYIKPEFVRTMDGIKINVEGTNLQTLNTLFDVLVASPKLTSPDNESIEIIGKGSPLIMVDRQAIISNDELKAIPANMVESIEIITNPSAKYKAQGRAGGVIEVYTKNFHLEGYSFTISSAGGINTQTKPTGNINLGINAKHGKLSLNGYLGFNYNKSNSFGNNSGYTTDNTNRTMQSGSTGEYWNSWQYYNVRSAYQITKKQKLTLGVRGHGSLNGSQSGGYKYYFKDSVKQTSEDWTDDSKYTWLNNSGFINYILETDTNRSALEINLNFTEKTSNSNVTSLSTYENIATGYNSDFRVKKISKDRPLVGELRVNYEHIFDTTGWKLNVGGTFSALYNGKRYDQFRDLTGDWMVDSPYTNSYNYREEIGALYAEASKNWDKVGVRAGVRGEYTVLNGYSQSLNKQFMDSSYLLPFPSASILLQPSEKVSMTFSYSTGIDRPQFSNYDPFVRIDDSLSISYGNPYLRPEYSQTIGFDMDLFNAYNFSVNYSYGKRPQSTLQFVDDSTYLVNSTPWNADNEQSINGSLSLPLQFKWLSGWNSCWVSYSKYTFTPNFGRDPFFNVTYGFYSYLTFHLPKNINLMNRMRLTKWGGATNRTNARFSWGLRLTKKMYDDKLQIYLDIDNIFPPKTNSYQFYGNFKYNSLGQTQFTAFKIGFFCKIGRLRQAVQIKESSPGESNRL